MGLVVDSYSGESHLILHDFNFTYLKKEGVELSAESPIPSPPTAVLGKTHINKQTHFFCSSYFRFLRYCGRIPKKLKAWFLSSEAFLGRTEIRIQAIMVSV